MGLVIKLVRFSFDFFLSSLPMCLEYDQQNEEHIPTNEASLSFSSFSFQPFDFETFVFSWPFFSLFF